MPLIAFEGLDQSGKETQAARLRAQLQAAGHRVEALTFPDDETPIGQEIRTALAGGRDWAPDVMQLLYIANRHERKPLIEAWLQAGVMIVCDRYLASSIAYGEALGLDPGWLRDVQRYLPAPDMTVLLDIAPETALSRKQAGRDRYERDVALLGRVRESYRRQAIQPGWVIVDGEQSREAVAEAITGAVRSRLGLPSPP
jgi:dTMP kinase